MAAEIWALQIPEEVTPVDTSQSLMTSSAISRMLGWNLKSWNRLRISCRWLFVRFLMMWVSSASRAKTLSSLIYSVLGDGVITTLALPGLTGLGRGVGFHLPPKLAPIIRLD